MKWLRGLAIALTAVAVIIGLLWLNRWSVLSIVIEQRGLAEPFVGLTADGTVRDDLFSLKPGDDRPALRDAVLAYLATLDPEQRAASVFAVDDAEWRKWMNVHFYKRQGLRLRDATPDQAAAFRKVLEQGLSPYGYRLASDIMKLDTTLAELNDNFVEYGEDLFHLTIMGEPSAQEPWGWQLDGHHLVMNYFTLQGQVVMSPLFLGAEPVIARQGVHQGTAVLQDVQDAGLALMLSLDAEQQEQARIGEVKQGNNAQAEFFSDNAIVPLAGIPTGAMQDHQRAALIALIRTYTGIMRDASANAKMSEVLDHLQETHFAWVGGLGEDDAFYYRIQSPVLYIEFDHQRPVGIRHLLETDAPHRDHVHVVIRTPNGNDYGKNLLAAHLAAQPH
ncbi:MAG: DUF3500 domain-containing protein [Pseudomonadota bacterium]